jgi:hypothetical protein
MIGTGLTCGQGTMRPPGYEVIIATDLLRRALFARRSDKKQKGDENAQEGARRSEA